MEKTRNQNVSHCSSLKDNAVSRNASHTPLHVPVDTPASPVIKNSISFVVRDIIKASISVSSVKANPLPSLSTLRLIIIGYYSTSESSTLKRSSLDGSQNTENSAMFSEEIKGSFWMAQIRNKSKCWGSTAHFHCPHFLFKLPGKWGKKGCVLPKPYKVCDRHTRSSGGSVIDTHCGQCSSGGSGPQSTFGNVWIPAHCWIWRFYYHLMRSQRFCKISITHPIDTHTITQAQNVNTSILYLRCLWEERVHI